MIPKNRLISGTSVFYFLGPNGSHAELRAGFTRREAERRGASAPGNYALGRQLQREKLARAAAARIDCRLALMAIAERVDHVANDFNGWQSMPGFQLRIKELNGLHEVRALTIVDLPRKCKPRRIEKRLRHECGRGDTRSTSLHSGTTNRCGAAIGIRNLEKKSGCGMYIASPELAHM